MVKYQGFTQRAVKDGYVRQEGDSFYFENMRTGAYLATGEDVHGKRIERRYIIDQSDQRSPWALWNDFCGRWGLRNIYHYSEDQGRILIYRA